MSASHGDRTPDGTGPAPTNHATRFGRRGRADSVEPDSVEPHSVGTATALGRRGRPVGTPGDPTGLGGRGRGRVSDAEERAAAAGASPGPDEVLRFGPGAPIRPASVPTWAAGGTTGPPKRRRPGRRFGALLVIAVVVAGLAFLLTRPHEALAVEAVSVQAAAPGTSCDTTVDVVGTVTTNGRAGSVTYQWWRNDGQPSAVLTQSVPTGTRTTEVHLPWTLTGRGRFDAEATLRVLEPGPYESVGRFTYSCSTRR